MVVSKLKYIEGRLMCKFFRAYSMENTTIVTLGDSDFFVDSTSSNR
jgi:hypothetical protein